MLICVLYVFCDLLPKIKAPGMADMPGESQEEPSVMVVTITCDDPFNLVPSDVFQAFPVACNLIALVSQGDATAANSPSDLFVENQRVKVLLRC